MSDYYNTLGVEKSATHEEIKKAYRKLAMQFHPDRHGGDKGMETKFKQVNEAYAVLSDQEKRSNYDRFGSAEGMGGMGGGAGGFSADFDISDIFSSVFGDGFNFGGGGGGRRQQKQMIGEDIEVIVDISFSESYSGIKKKVEYKKNTSCPTCDGSGAQEGSEPETCSVCKGQGHVIEQTRSIFGIMQQQRVCHECHGQGTIIKDPCKECKGNKVISLKVEKTVEIPAGIDNGMSIKMTSEGHQIPGGVSGDLYVTCRVEQEYQGLERKGQDMYYTLELDPVEVVLGTKKEIAFPLIGKRKIDIHAGTLDGKVIKFSHDGMKSVQRDVRGDLFITCKILVPKKLSKEEKKLYEQIAELKKKK